MIIKRSIRFFFVIITLLLIASIPQKTFASQILFQDDFDDGNADGWEEHVGTGGSWKVENGEYIGEAKQISFPISTNAIAGDVNWTNYTYEVKVKGVTGVDKKIRFRYKSNGEYYELNLRSGLFNDLAVGKIAQNGWLQFVSVPNSVGVWYEIKIEVKDSNIKIYIDGILKFDFSDNDNPILNGKIGLEVWPGAAALTTINRFDNIKVTEIESIPEPFLDLPWDYREEGKNMNFRDAALSINSYFDHKYPLLRFYNKNTGWCLPESEDLLPTELVNEMKESPLKITKYNGVENDQSYNCHDGYDYGKSLAKLKLGDSVMAAADGCAIYRNWGSGGNTIWIDHGNGYQTRYLHMQSTGLVTQETNPDNCVDVEKGDVIGNVGFSGNVRPSGQAGSHLHFMVIQDRDEDGDFNDDYPWGVTDPFGWEPDNVDDPWVKFSYQIQGQEKKTGNASHYLWLGDIYGFSGLFKKNEVNNISAGRYNYSFPADTFEEDVYIEEKGGGVVKTPENKVSLGSISNIIAKNALGNLIFNLLKPSLLTIEFGTFDLSPFKPETLSIYSSEDGENWTKEETTIDWENKIASAQINHLSKFTLMGERADIIPPTTTAILSGDEGDAGWFRSDVEITLDAQDNDGGLGVDYTLYRINDQEWQEYVEPFTVIDEGTYKIEYYSVDNDENIEKIKSEEFHVDKTKPTGSIIANPEIIWPPNNKMVDVIVNGSSYDNEGVSSTIFEVVDEYDEVEPLITSFGKKIQLKAKRNGNDKDGRFYVIKLKVIDLAGNISEYTTQVIVPHDQS